MSKFLSKFGRTGAGRRFTDSSDASTLVNLTEEQSKQAQNSELEPEAELHGLIELYPPKITGVVEQIATSLE